MIDQEILKNQSVRLQTSFTNVLREYLQHLFLANFYQKRESQNFLFKGGTALRLVFGSPRFSEDLDFSALKNSVGYEKILERVLLNFSLENIKTELIESKPTSGGHLAILSLALFGEKIDLQNEISFRPRKKLRKETMMIAPTVNPAYKIYLLDRKMIVMEKVRALMRRQKPRDFFDLYFILRNKSLRSMIKLTEKQRKKFFSLIGKQDKVQVYQELRPLLPKSFWSVIKDLPRALKREIEGK